MKKAITKKEKREFFLNPIVHWVLIALIILNAIGYGLLAFFIRPVDFPIILHYNVYFGVDLIGSWWQVYFFPTIALIISFINLILAYNFFVRKERVISHVLLLAAMFVQVGIIIAEASIIQINY